MRVKVIGVVLSLWVGVRKVLKGEFPRTSLFPLFRSIQPLYVPVSLPFPGIRQFLWALGVSKTQFCVLDRDESYPFFLFTTILSVFPRLTEFQFSKFRANEITLRSSCLPFLERREVRIIWRTATAATISATTSALALGQILGITPWFDSVVLTLKFILEFFHAIKCWLIKKGSNLHLEAKRAKNIVGDQIDTLQGIWHRVGCVRSGVIIWIAAIKAKHST
jgi:hypothetical protein